MPNDVDDDFGQDDPHGSQTVKDLRDHSKGLERDLRASRAEAEQAKVEAAEAATLRRELAFRRAGVDPDDPKAKYFVKGYDGELTAEAIKAEADAAGIGGAATAATQTRTIDEELGRLDRSSATSSTTRDPGRDAEFDAAVAQAQAEKWPVQEFDAMLKRFGRLAAE